MQMVSRSAGKGCVEAPGDGRTPVPVAPRAPASQSIVLHPLGPQRLAGWTRFACRVEGCHDAPDSVYFDIEDRFAPDFPSGADPLLLAMLFSAMRAGADVEVEGHLSPRLLDHLDRFMLIWSKWCPEEYRRIAIRCTGETEQPARSAGPEAVALFSGGVDSAFTLWRHHRGEAGRRNRRINTALFVQGADIPLSHTRQLAASTDAARRMANSLGVDLAVLRTNTRDFRQNWEHAHGAVLAGCLHAFSAARQYGLIAATLTIGEFDAPWGSHPMTDPLLGNEAFHIEDDGLDVSRLAKVDAIGAWPEAMENLRVCYFLPDEGINCGLCRKCVLAKLSFLSCGHPLPATLPGVPSASAILALRDGPPWVADHLANALARARELGLASAPWARALRLALRIRRGGAAGSWAGTGLTRGARLIESWSNRKGMSA